MFEVTMESAASSDVNSWSKFLTSVLLADEGGLNSGSYPLARTRLNSNSRKNGLRLMSSNPVELEPNLSAIFLSRNLLHMSCDESETFRLQFPSDINNLKHNDELTCPTWETSEVRAGSYDTFVEHLYHKRVVDQ